MCISYLYPTWPLEGAMEYVLLTCMSYMHFNHMASMDCRFYLIIWHFRITLGKLYTRLDSQHNVVSFPHPKDRNGLIRKLFVFKRKEACVFKVYVATEGLQG